MNSDEAKTFVINKSPAYLRTLNTNLFSICPICAREDIEKHGLPIRYIHHCYPDIKACYKHKCNLIQVEPFKEVNDVDITEATEEDVNYSEWIDNLISSDIKSIDGVDELITSLYKKDWKTFADLPSEEAERYSSYIHFYGTCNGFSYSEKLRALYFQFPSIEELKVHIDNSKK